MPTACPDDDVLRHLLLGLLPAERAAPLEDHFSACPQCAARAERASQSDVLIGAMRARAGTAGPERARVAQLAERLVHVRSATRAAWAPARLGQFRIVRELGRGGMGYVFEAEDEKLERRVAVKVLTPELAGNPEAVARFLREARAAAAVEHDHIVPILHVGEDAGTAYIVMPLLLGESLQARLTRDGKLPSAEVRRLGRELAAGLGAAHARGLIHRDLKPANIWLEDTGRARILDFGLARLNDGGKALTAPGKLLGTPAYMAPEQIDGRTDARSDLFSLGATLYECATGQRAFEAPTLMGVLKAVANHHPPEPVELDPEMPVDLSALIVRLLAKDPACRPLDCQAVTVALADEFGATTAVYQERRRAGAAPRRSWAWAVAALAVVCLGVVGAWLATRPTDRTDATTTAPVAVPFHGKLDVLIERIKDGRPQLLRLNETGALPLRKTDRFRIEGEVEPPAYVYLFWIDPHQDITPVYPWDPTKGWNSRPDVEKPLGRISLPPNAGNRYTAPDAAPGVATMVLLARPTPLDVADEQLNAWLSKLPNLSLPTGGETAAVWFDDYVEVREPLRRRTFGVVGSQDEFAGWQGQLQQAMGRHAAFQTAVSFARTGRK